MESGDAYFDDNRKPHGGRLPLRLKGGVIARGDRDGRMCGFAGNLIDVAEPRGHQTASVSQLSTMSETAACIAHEIAQPLHVIMSYAQACTAALKDEHIDVGRISEWTLGIEQAATLAGEMLRRMRDFAQQGQLKQSTFDIEEVIHEAMHLLAFDAKQFNINLEVNLSARQHHVCADPVQILQVLVNLLRNAFESCATIRKAVRRVCIESSSDEDFLSIYVSDNGAGLTETVRTRMFEPFFTTKTDGIGIGLAICRNIVAAHGGELVAEAKNAGGAVFTLSLRLAEEQPNEI